jgi:hypothetical protein
MENVINLETWIYNNRESLSEQSKAHTFDMRYRKHLKEMELNKQEETIKPEQPIVINKRRKKVS